MKKTHLNFSAPLLTMSELAPLLHQSQTQGQKVVLTNGCFDILHLGHVRYLQATRAYGDILVLGVNTDASVQRLKGPSRPINPEVARAEVLAALACVSYVTLFGEQTAATLIETLKPNLYVKAGDYTLETLPERETLMRLGIQVHFMPFEEGYSTTNTIAKIQTPSQNSSGRVI